MFARIKRTGDYEYLQIVENRRENGRTRQRVVATLGRLDKLQAAGEVDVLLASLGRFAKRIRIQEAHARGDLKALGAWSIGPAGFEHSSRTKRPFLKPPCSYGAGFRREGV